MRKLPRRARRKSKTGIYHVVLRGINRQIIFEDEEDYNRLLETLKRYKAICEYRLFAYCLMGNHFHLLLEVGKEDLGLILKRIAGSYVYWYNLKYRRNGHLFQDRYKSEPIGDDSYFLTVLRYIHRNPMGANLSETVSGYKWSSYGEYVGGPSSSGIVDTGFALEMTGIVEFKKYSEKSNDDRCLEDMNNRNRLTDKDAKAIMMESCKCDTVEAFLKISPQERRTYINIMCDKGISIRQLSRLTGISKGVIEGIRGR